MTQKEFKEGLLRGQGRCIQAVQVDPDKYYKHILWVCHHEIFFDAQCEGTRAWYGYQLINCYQNKISFLEVVIQRFDGIKGWHGIHLDILRMADVGIKAPVALLQHIYETTYCSCCRERVFLQMRKRRMLTNDILQECLLDSNEDIRTYANQYLKKRNR